MRTRLLALFLIIVLISPSFSRPAMAVDHDNGPSSLPTDQSIFFVPSAQQTISSVNLTFWTTNNGLQTLGMPVTSVDGRNKQIFQFGSLRQGKGEAITRDQAGTQLVSLKYGPQTRGVGRFRASASITTAFTPLAEAPSGDSVEFDTHTGHSIKGSIAEAYASLGGRDVLGRPISEAYQYGSVRLQWFENAALMETGNGVQLAPIGPELAMRSSRTTPQVTGGFRPVYLDRYTTTTGDGTLADASTVFAPVAIQIPAIGVDANVENVPITDGVMETPQDVWSVGWYYDLPAPGQFTNVVMAGHKDWWGVGPVVFWSLGDLVSGDMIYLWDANGVGATYQIDDVESVDADINPNDVIKDRDADTLTLITCGGDFDGQHYLSRVIVVATRV